MISRKKARKAIRTGDFLTAAQAFSDIANKDPNDIDAYLQAARCYQKSNHTEPAADWYLKAAKLYAQMGIGVQAAALLRHYRDLRPQDIETCRILFRQCRTQTAEPEELLDMLSDDDKACYTMRYGEIFSALDDASFDSLLDDMQVHELKKGDILVRMGEPAQSLFLIAEGAVQAWMVKNGKRISLGKMGAGSVCGEVPLFIGIQKRTGDLIACAPTRIIEIQYTLIKQIQQSNNSVMRSIDTLYRRHLLERQLALNTFFQVMPAPFRQQVAQQMTAVRVRAGGVLFHEGDATTDLYLVRSGSLSINIDTQGTETLFKIIKAGGLAGEIAIGNNGQRNATARAMTDVVLMRWKAADYQDSYQKNEYLQSIVAERLAEQQQQITLFCNMSETPVMETGIHNKALMAELLTPIQKEA